jgi:hypothetical protein
MICQLDKGCFGTPWIQVYENGREANTEIHGLFVS